MAVRSQSRGSSMLSARVAFSRMELATWVIMIEHSNARAEERGYGFGAGAKKREHDEVSESRL